MEQIEKIIADYLPQIYRFVYGMVLSKDEAEDIVQDVFIKVWKKRYSLAKDRSPKAYLFQIARTTTVDYFRKRKHEVFSAFDTEEGVYEETLISDESLPDELFEKAETVELVTELLKNIPPQYREVVLMHVYEEMTFQEIADLTDSSINTVKSTYRRALIKLHQKMK